jgi:hypothetical protein
MLISRTEGAVGMGLFAEFSELSKSGVKIRLLAIRVDRAGRNPSQRRGLNWAMRDTIYELVDLVKGLARELARELFKELRLLVEFMSQKSRFDRTTLQASSSLLGLILCEIGQMGEVQVGVANGTMSVLCEHFFWVAKEIEGNFDFFLVFF